MGWEDAPLAEEKPAWESAPLAEEHMPEYAPPLLEKIKQTAKIFPTIGTETLGAVAEPIAALATGAIAKPVSEIAGLAATGYEMARGGEGAQNIPGFQRELQEKLTYQPRTAAGASPYNPLNFIPMALGKAFGLVTPEKAAEGEALTPAGIARNIASEAIPQAIGLAGMKAAPKAAIPAKKAATVLRQSAEDLMQSALKPTPKDLLNGKAAKAIDTMLEKGIPATPKGIEQVRIQIDALNEQIKDVIANSPERVKTRKLMRPVVQKLKEFKDQANPDADVKAIKDAWNEFKNTSAVKAGTGYVETVEGEVAGREAAAAKALQDAWKLKTFEEQQKGLAHGGGIRSSEIQPEGQPYINVGGIGVPERISTSAYPVRGMPRIAGKYTEQIERVPEGAAGYQDAMEVYRIRKAEADAARAKLAEAQAKEGTISVQKAQAIKQGTYKQLAKKYGQLGSAEVEAQKAIARGLKEQVAAKVPEVAPLNLEESKLLNVLSVAERRIVMEANKNPMGLALLTKDPKAWAAFMADRSAAAKSLLARIMDRTSKKMASAATSGSAERAMAMESALVPTQTEKEIRKAKPLAEAFK